MNVRSSNIGDGIIRAVLRSLTQFPRMCLKTAHHTAACTVHHRSWTPPLIITEFLFCHTVVSVLRPIIIEHHFPVNAEKVSANDEID